MSHELWDDAWNEALPTLEDEQGVVVKSTPLSAEAHKQLSVRKQPPAVSNSHQHRSSSSDDSDEQLFKQKRKKLLQMQQSVQSAKTQRSHIQLQSTTGKLATFDQFPANNPSSPSHRTPSTTSTSKPQHRHTHNQTTTTTMDKEDSSDLEITGSNTTLHGHVRSHPAPQPFAKPGLLQQSRINHQSKGRTDVDDNFADLLAMVQSSDQTLNRSKVIEASLQAAFINSSTNPSQPPSTTPINQTKIPNSNSKTPQPNQLPSPSRSTTTTSSGNSLSNQALSRMVISDLRQHDKLIQNAKQLQNDLVGVPADVEAQILSAARSSIAMSNNPASTGSPPVLIAHTSSTSIPSSNRAPGQNDPPRSDYLDQFGEDTVSQLKSSRKQTPQATVDALDLTTSNTNSSSEADAMLRVISNQSARHTTSRTSALSSMRTPTATTSTPPQPIPRKTTQFPLPKNTNRKLTADAPTATSKPSIPPPQTESTNIFALYHISPTEATKFMNQDTMAYLRHIRCPAIFPFDPAPLRTPTPQTDPYASVFSASTTSGGVSSFIQSHTNTPVNTSTSSQPFAFQTRLAIPTFTGQQPTLIHFRQQVVLSFTPLLVAKHIVQNIRNFENPLHNVYCAMRFNTVFPVSLCGGYTMGRRETTRALNSDAPIELFDSDDDDDDDDDDDGDDDNDDFAAVNTTSGPMDDVFGSELRTPIPFKPNSVDSAFSTPGGKALQSVQENPRSSEPTKNVPLFDLLTPHQREKLNAHNPMSESALNPIHYNSKGQQVQRFTERPLTDAQLQWLYHFIIGSQNSNPSQGSGGRSSNSIELSDDDDDDDNDHNKYTDGVVNAMLDFIKDDIENDRNLRNMLRPLVMYDIEEDIRSNKVSAKHWLTLAGLPLDKIETYVNAQPSHSQGRPGVRSNGNTLTPLMKNPSIRHTSKFQQAARRVKLPIPSSQTAANEDGCDDSNDDVVVVDHHSDSEDHIETTDTEDETCRPPIPLPSVDHQNQQQISNHEQSDEDAWMEEFFPASHAHNQQSATSAPMVDGDGDLFDDPVPQPPAPTETTPFVSTAQVIAELASGVKRPKKVSQTSNSIADGTATAPQPPATECSGGNCACAANPKVHKRCVQVPKHSSNSEVLKLMMGKFTCPVCLGKIRKNLGSTKCGHFACYACLRRSVSLVKLCPICRQPTTMKEVFRLFG